MQDLDDILRRGFGEYRAFVNPLIAQRAALATEPTRIVRIEEGCLVDADGDVIEDFHGTQAFGHRHPAITRAVVEYLGSDAPSWFPSRVHPFAGRLARRLHERTGYDNAFFACTGSDTVEAAIKLARALTGRPRLLGLDGAYHGCTMGSLSLMQPGYLRAPFGPHLPGAETIPFGDVDALARALAAGDVAAVVVEPIQGEGGVRALPAAYVDALCELTERHGTLLVADEVQTGLGRTGRGFLASEGWPRRPDAVCLAKHLGGGLAPLGAMLTRRELFLRAYGDNLAAGEAHNTTLGANALSLVASLAALELLTDELITRVRDVGQRFEAQLTSALGGSSLVAEVRGEGLMLGVALNALDHPWLSFEHFGMPELADRPAVALLLCRQLYRRGFFCFTCGHDWSVLRMQPRFEVPEPALSRFAQVAAEELARLEAAAL